MKKTILLIAGLWVSFFLHAQVLKTVTTTAGSLSSALTTIEKNTVTNLTINGTIDARDFKTMRDNMPLLSVVDISGAAINAYTGTEGTLDDNTTYSANSVPACAFYKSGTTTIDTMHTSITLPGNITAINGSAFRNCTRLSYINLPSGLITIQAWVFAYAGDSLVLNIPASATSVSDEAFQALDGYINVDTNNPTYSSEDGVFFNKTKTWLYQCPTTKSGSYTVPSTVTNIRRYSFVSCKMLTEIIVPPSVTQIDYYTFRDCQNLASIFLPNTLTKIVDFAFLNCYKLESITIPASVTSIGSGSFYYCNSLASIYSYSATPVDISSVTSNPFSYVDTVNCNLYIPNGSLAAYMSATRWKDFDHIYEIGGYQLSGNKRGIGANQNSQATVDLHAYTIWSTTSNQSWLTCSPASGNYDATLTLTADVNLTDQSRIAKVYVDAPGYISHYITVTQAAGPGISNDLEITNRVLADQTSTCFGAFNTITVAGNNTSVIFQNGSSVNLVAGQSIQFLSGFHAENGAWMNASITTDNTFCSTSISSVVAVLPQEKSSEIKEDKIIHRNLQGEKNIKLFPNPATGHIWVELNNFENAALAVYNFSGANIFQLSSVSTGVYPINLSGLHAGIYFLKVTDGKKQHMQKFILK